MDDCKVCRGMAPRCPSCRRVSVIHLRGTAQCRGQAWANRVVHSITPDKPWPAFEGRCAELAARQVADIAPNDPAILAELAPEVWKGANRAWEELRLKRLRTMAPTVRLRERGTFEAAV